MSNVILEAIQNNIDPTSTGMNMVGITKVGDGTSCFNKTNGKRKATEKVLMEASVKEGGLGFSPESIISETKNTYLVGSDYQTLQNNRIKKAVKALNTAVSLNGGSDAVEMILEGIQEKANDGKAFESKSLPWGEWVKGWEGVLIKHTKDGKENHYLRVYNETGGEGSTIYQDHDGEIMDVDSPKYSTFRKAKRKKSGKVSELQSTLSNIVDVENEEISEALELMKPIRPEVLNLENIKVLTLNGTTFRA